MAYIKRKGLRLNLFITLLTIGILVASVFFVDWEKQFAVFLQYGLLSQPILSITFTLIVSYILAGFLGASIWYFLGKLFSPLLSGYLFRFFGGLTSETFIDRNVNQADMGFFKFVGMYINTFLVLFTLDFFLANSFFYNQGRGPQFVSFLFALAILSIFQPFHLVLDGIGIRAYNKGNAEVVAITSVLDRFVFRLLQTGGLLGVFASISVDNQILDQIPASIRIIFVRTALIGLLIMFFYQLIFQPEGVAEAWEQRRIRHGATHVDFE
ncbi:MAG: hypothetical protein ACXAE3_10265 [Candidatus Kariarchaeaceae archaeon]